MFRLLSKADKMVLDFFREALKMNKNKRIANLVLFVSILSLKPKCQPQLIFAKTWT